MDIQGVVSTTASAPAFEAAQREVVERLAGGAQLDEILERIVLLIERQASELRASILLFDAERGCVRHGAAPHLPPALVQAFDGAPLGPRPGSGSSGTADARTQPVVVEDIAAHPFWTAYKDFVLPHGLRACWSTPIVDTDRAVLGTFALYTRETRGPTAREKELIAKATHLAAVAIAHDRARRRDIRETLEGGPRVQDPPRRLPSERPWAGELTHLTRGGKEIPVEASWTLVRDDHGRPQSVLAIHTDVSDRKRVEARVFRAQRMESLGTMAGGIAHDFNNILAAILGNARLAAHILPEEAGSRECFDAIESACARAADLVKRLTTFSRPHDVERRLLEPRPVVEEALKLMRTSWPGVEVHTRFAAETPAIFADETQIHQIVMNLGANAAQAMKGSAGRVEVELEPVTVDEELPLRSTELRPGVYARLSVRDTGSGMDEATLARIFDPFFTTKPDGEGTGLGLSVVQGIVKEHGGSITVHSRPGRGTVFHIYLPAASQTTAWAAAAEAASVDPPRGRGEHILYVDDDEAMVVLATRSLERLGYRVTGFTDPGRAINAFRARPNEFDAVVSDLSMPGMTEVDLSRAVLVAKPYVIQYLGRVVHAALALRSA